MYEDEKLICKECGKEFIFTAGEQEFYAEHNLQNKPQRCRTCRNGRKENPSDDMTKLSYIAVCAACGGEARVPFEPTMARPIFCSMCYSKRKKNKAVAK